jgi:hypothetical protein
MPASKHHGLEKVDLLPAVVIDIYPMVHCIRAYCRSQRSADMPKEVPWRNATSLAATLVATALNEMLLWIDNGERPDHRALRSGIPDIAYQRKFWLRLYLLIYGTECTNSTLVDEFIHQTELAFQLEYNTMMKPIVDAVKPPSWRMWTLKQVDMNLILIDEGDYRIKEWHRLMAEQSQP